MKASVRSSRVLLMLACIGTMSCAVLAQGAPPDAPPRPAQGQDQQERSPRHDPPDQRPQNRGAEGPRGGGDQVQREQGRRDPGQPQDERGGRRGARSMRLLDLRDMEGMLPPPPPPPPPPQGAQDPVFGGRPGPFGVAPDAATPSSGAEGAMDLVQRLAGPLDLTVSSVSPGVVLVGGPDEAQAKLEELLAKVRDMYRETYEVELVVAIFPAGSAPVLGGEMTGGKVMTRSRQAMCARTPTMASAIEEMQFVAGWLPVVADNSVGYQTVLGSVGQGLMCKVTVGGGDTGGGATARTQVRVRGEISVASLTPSVSEVTSAGGKASLAISLPRRQVRTIDSTADVNPGTTGPVAIAVLSGFEPDQVIVVGASATPRPAK